MAIKRIPKFKQRVSREVVILSSLHLASLPPCNNVIRLFGFQYGVSSEAIDESHVKQKIKPKLNNFMQKGKVIQNIILEYLPTNLDRFIFKNKELITESQIRSIVTGLL